MTPEDKDALVKLTRSLLYRFDEGVFKSLGLEAPDFNDKDSYDIAVVENDEASTHGRCVIEVTSTPLQFTMILNIDNNPGDCAIAQDPLSITPHMVKNSDGDEFEVEEHVVTAYKTDLSWVPEVREMTAIVRGVDDPDEIFGLFGAK